METGFHLYGDFDEKNYCKVEYIEITRGTNMKKTMLFLIIFIFLTHHLFSMDYTNNSISFDPLTFIGIFFIPDNGESQFVDLRNLWLAVDINWETEKQREMGLGLFLRGDRVAITTKYRMFHNKETQSGFFWGLYGLIEWRRLYWYYDKNSEITIGWTFPFVGHDNVYHSIGITGGIDIGFRIRSNSFGITPYLGLGIPLFYCFGDLPPEKNTQEFNIMNITLRAINIGLRLDFFTR
jgi:hypothetical protein